MTSEADLIAHIRSNTERICQKTAEIRSETESLRQKASVMRGWEQAQRPEFVDPPDLDEDERLAAMIPD